MVEVTVGSELKGVGVGAAVLVKSCATDDVLLKSPSPAVAVSG